ncbi:MAG: acetate/propionate family kinase, partial [Panacagrimonas sp.]
MTDQATPQRRLLVLNGGSASFKWTLFGPDPDDVCSGSTAGIEEGLREVLAQIPRPDAVGHRVVHGGHRFTQSVRLDPGVRKELESLVPLAPLHQPMALRGIDQVTACWPGVKQILCFDTAFHSTLSEAASAYALPREWSETYGLRRFGAHGLSVEWSLGQVTERLGSTPRRLLVCHLGGGASMTAVQDGISIDTTMGFTPLEGPMMGTRSGSVDPGVLLYLLRECGIGVSALADGLQRQGGLLGMSGVSADLRTVRTAALGGDTAPTAAIDHLLWTYRRAAGAMSGVLGGVDAVVFTGGIGEHHAFVRSAIASALSGCVLDTGLNALPEGDREISGSGSGIRAFVITAHEDRVIRD